MNDYCEDLTNYINTHSGLDSLVPEQVRFIINAERDFIVNKRHATTGSPINSAPRQWTEPWWATRPPDVQARRCTARRSNGTGRCLKAAMDGQKVCGTHGGRARQSMQAAKRRLMEQADPAVKKLTEIAYDATNPVETRLKATLAIIDRSVGGAKTELEISAKPVDQIMEQVGVLEGGSRAEFRRSQGIADQSDQAPKALPVTHTETVDAEIVDDFHTYAPMQSQPQNQQHDDQGDTYDDDDWYSDRGPVAAAANTGGADYPDDPLSRFDPPPDAGLMNRTDAYAAQADMRRRVADQARAAGHATVRRIGQRALPPGRS